jgi:hypothetical protein
VIFLLFEKGPNPAPDDKNSNIFKNKHLTHPQKVYIRGQIIQCAFRKKELFSNSGHFKRDILE